MTGKRILEKIQSINWIFPIFLVSLVYRCASTIIANSQASKLDLIDLYGVKIKKIKVFQNSIDDPMVRSIPKSNSSIFQIVCIGRLEHHKGQDILIKALQFLNNRGINSAQILLDQEAKRITLSHWWMN
jgi:glycosyltransferase involved in cell wall biosynthesis